ncbi:MAG: leucine-rich repeat domain-containing protein, partial [Flavobacterium sp.]
MKKLLLLVLLVATVSNAQNVSIPDSEFLNALIYLGVDTNGDGTIQVSEAAARTSLDLTTAVQYYMHDVSGIEAFVNLTVLKLPLANSIQSLNVGSMNALEYLQINGSHNLSVLTFGYHPYLTHLDCGNSSLTTLDLSGAPNLTYLDCSQNYLNSLDLSMLSQLTHLNTHFNPLLALDVSNSPNLTFLDCSQGLVLGSSGIASVNINGCIHLTHLDISSNSISVLNVAPLSELVYLDVSGNAISALDVSNLNGLTYLGANGNPITVLNVSALTNLTTLNCNLCLITTLDVAALTNLTSLSCSGNQIGVLNVSNLSNLTYLDCSANQISSLNLQNLNVLNVLYCQNNMLANLSVSANTTLHGLYFGNPGLNTVDVGMLTNLTGIGYFGGLQQSLNISGLSLLSSVALSGISGSFDLSNFNGQPVSQFTLYNNPDLTYLNIKTGQHVEALFSNNPVLTNICTNEDDIQYVTDHMNNGQNNFDFTVSSYCSFTPGGSYNTISGVFHLDANNDGCTATDVIPPSVKVSINDGTIVGSTFTNSLGSYSVYSNGTNIVLTPQLENPAYFNVSPTSQTMTFPDDNNHVSTADFCMTANGIHPDVEVTIVPLHPARPGFDADYNIILKNKGNQVFAGALDFSYNDSVLDLLSSVPLADAQSLGSLSWNYTGLNPFATQIFHVSFNVNSPSETPPVNINDVLDFTASAAVANDETPADNSFTLHQVVVGSFDPNDKHCLQGDVVPTAQIG